MPCCCAYNCSERTEKGTRVFLLPQGSRNNDRRKQWIDNINRKDLPETAYVCEKHFTYDQFENNREDNKRPLRWNAIPTLFSHKIIPKPRKSSKIRINNNKKVLNEDKSKSNLNAVLYAKCRICLQFHNHYKNILTTIVNEVLISQMIFDCASVKVQQNDNTINVCDNCVLKLVAAYELRLQIVKSDLQLKNILPCIIEIKGNSGCKSNSTISKILAHETTLKEECIEIEINDKHDYEHNDKICKMPEIHANRATIKEENEEFDTDNNWDHTNNGEINGIIADDKTSVIEKHTEIENNDNLDNENHDTISETTTKEVYKQNNPKKIKHPCKLCSKSFISKSYLSTHIKEHLEDKPFECETCHKKFSMSWKLKAHQRYHSELTPYSCEICGRLFKFLAILKIHQQKHSGIRSFKCDICDKSFSAMGILKQHKLTHSDERPYICELCGKQFRNNGALTLHSVTHSEGKFPCPTCGKLFKLRRALRVHERSHSGRRDFPCKLCEKKFITSSTLRRHMRIHDGIKPYTCTICSKSFSQSNILTLHMRIHTGEKPYQCSVCSETFTYKYRLQKHMHKHEAST